MKIKTTLKTALLAIGLLLHFNLQAQDAPPITIHVATAGTLSSLILPNKKFEITNLTITGNLNGTDIRYIREMAGSDVRGNGTNGKLSILNLADAYIVSGGDYYVDYYSNINYTANNSISDDMFYKCTRLKSVTIPSSVTKIGNYVFSFCTELTKITIPNSVTKIGKSAFYGCKELTSIAIPNSVTEIGGNAFRDCARLTEITIPDSIIEIGSSAFWDCLGLTSITIPNSVTLIGGYAFYGCSGLTEFTIPNKVTSIGSYAFYGCTGLTSIIIPNSVTSIESYAFFRCTGLKKIYATNPVSPTCVSSAFNNVSKTDCILYVPIGSYSAYSKAEGWKDFKKIVEMKL